MSAPIGAPLLDHDMALARVGGDEELLKEIAALFLDEYPRVLDELHRAIYSGDSKAVEHTAHGLKGSVANFGAQAAVDAAFRIEQLGRAQRVDEASAAMPSLELALSSLHLELAAL